MCRADSAALKNALRPLEPYLELTGTNEVIVDREHEVVLEGLSGWEFVRDKNITKEMFLSVGRILANRATRECSFEWRDLRETPSVVFIKFPQQDAQSLGVLTALFFETFFGWALDVPKKPDECPIAILADEFASLPKINLMTDFLSKGAGMGAVVWLIVQDFAQIKATYGDKAFETIKTNCSYLLVYAQNNYATQKELAEMVGKATRKRKSVSKSGKGGVSVSENDEGLDLIPVAVEVGTVGYMQMLFTGALLWGVYATIINTPAKNVS